MKKGSLAYTWKLMKQRKNGYLFVAPFMILFTLFTVVPVLIGIRKGIPDLLIVDKLFCAGGFRIVHNISNLNVSVIFGIGGFDIHAREHTQFSGNGADPVGGGIDDYADDADIFRAVGNAHPADDIR